MAKRLSLRLRIFLFFCLLAVGAVVLAVAAMAFVWARADQGVSLSQLITACVIFSFLNTGLILGIWLLFDEHVARPIETLSTNLRLRAHSGVDAGLSMQAAQYLGDLAPAAQALSKASQPPPESTEHTRRLIKERERLTALLSEIPIGTILVNAAKEIVLYDAQAAAILATIAPPRLGAPLADYFDLTALPQLRASGTSLNGAFQLSDIGHHRTFNTRIKALGEEGDIIFIDYDTSLLNDAETRPLVFDFDLLEREMTADAKETKLSDLCFVVFDTETTGLSVETDAIVQIAAQRVMNGRLVEGEVFDAYVNPGRAIPPASTKIHGVRDADVADAPSIEQVIPAFHHFAKDAVLVAHNAPFDIGLLRQQERATGIKWDHPVLDTVLLSAVVFGISQEHSLDALCQRLAIEIPAQHRHTALGDAKATAEALVKLLPLLQGKGIETFGALVQETRKHGRLLKDMNPKQPKRVVQLT